MSTQKIMAALVKSIGDKTNKIDDCYRETSVWMSNEFELISKLIKQNPRDAVFEDNKETHVDEPCVIEEPAPIETKSAKRKSSEAAAFTSNLSPELKRQSIDFEQVATAAGLPSDLNKLKKDDLLRELTKRGKKPNAKDNKPVHVAALKEALLEEYSAQQYATKQQPFTEVPSSSSSVAAPVDVEPTVEPVAAKTNTALFNTYPPASTPSINTTASATVTGVPTAPAAESVFYSPSKQRKGSLMSDFRKQVNMSVEPAAPVEAPDAKQELQRRRESQAARKSISVAKPEEEDGQQQPMSPGGVSVSSGGFEDALEAPMAPLDLAELSVSAAAAAPVEEQEEEAMQMASPVRATAATAEIPCTPAAGTPMNEEVEEEDEEVPQEPVAAPADSEEQEEDEEIFSDVDSLADEDASVDDDFEIVETLAPTAAPTTTTAAAPAAEEEGERIALDYTSPSTVQRDSSSLGGGSVAPQQQLQPSTAAAALPVCPVSPDDSVASISSATTTASNASSIAAAAAKAPEVLVNKPMNLMGAKSTKSSVAAIEQAKKLKEFEEQKEAAKKLKLEQMRNAKNPTASFTGNGSVKSVSSNASTSSTTSTASSAAASTAGVNKTKTVVKPSTTTAAASAVAPVAIKPPAPAAAVVNTTTSSVVAPATTAAPLKEIVPPPPAPTAATSTPKKGVGMSLFGAIFGGNKSPTPAVAPPAAAPISTTATAAATAPVKKSSFDISVVETKNSSSVPKPNSPDAPFSVKPATTTTAAAPSSMMSPTKPDPFKNKAAMNSILQNFKEAQAATTAPTVAPIVDLHKAAAVLKPQPVVTTTTAPAVKQFPPAPAPTPAFSSPSSVKPATVAAVPVHVNATPLKDITAKITGATPTGPVLPKAASPMKEGDTMEYPIEDRPTSDEEDEEPPKEGEEGKEGDENSATEDEAAKKKENDKIPAWAKGPEFIKALEAQFGAHGGVPMDPDTIFNPPSTCNLELIFGTSKGKHRTYAVRSSSAHWDADSLTLVEKRTYRTHMGYDKQQQQQTIQL